MDDAGPDIRPDDTIELDVPLDHIGGYITTLFNDSEFISERQRLEIVQFDYEEETTTFHFVLKVVTERSH